MIIKYSILNLIFSNTYFVLIEVGVLFQLGIWVIVVTITNRSTYYNTIYNLYKSDINDIKIIKKTKPIIYRCKQNVTITDVVIGRWMGNFKMILEIV